MLKDQIVLDLQIKNPEINQRHRLLDQVVMSVESVWNECGMSVEWVWNERGMGVELVWNEQSM